jgi:phage shock protein E
VTPDALRDAIARDAAPAILDVRTAREFADGHVPGAINIPFTQIGARISELALPRGESLLVYCGHGPRAWIAARALRRAGFSRIGYLRGHMAAWRRAGLPEARG